MYLEWIGVIVAVLTCLFTYLLLPPARCPFRWVTCLLVALLGGRWPR
jgi:hypothetical protein